MYPRRITPRLLEALADTPVVYLQGARQTGKSTLARQIAGGPHPARYLSLDTAAVRAAAESDPEGFVAGLGGPAVIDEVQRAPGLAVAIKAAVDADRTPGRFLLTGSADVMALPAVSESLAGRVELHTLWPLSAGEVDAAGGDEAGDEAEGESGGAVSFVDRLFGNPAELVTMAAHAPPLAFGDLVARAAAGGYPEALARADPARRAAWFDSYVSTILQRDVRAIADVAGLSELPRLLSLLATRAGSLLNYADLSRSLAMPQTTLKRYAALLEATFLVRPLPPWSGNPGRRLVKSPKLMMVDTGLLAHLAGPDPETFAPDAADAPDRTPAGPLLENFAAMELAKQLGWSRARCRLYHYRAESGAEVDLVLEDRRGRLAAVEVKATATVRDRDLRGLRHLQESLGDRVVSAVLLHTGPDAVPFGPRLHALPFASLWSGG